MRINLMIVCLYSFSLFTTIGEILSKLVFPGPKRLFIAGYSHTQRSDYASIINETYSQIHPSLPLLYFNSSYYDKIPIT